MMINSCLAIKIYFVGAMFELTIKILKVKDIKHKGQKEKVQKDRTYMFIEPGFIRTLLLKRYDTI
jgi:hypothetical protein